MTPKCEIGSARELKFQRRVAYAHITPSFQQIPLLWDIWEVTHPVRPQRAGQLKFNYTYPTQRVPAGAPQWLAVFFGEGTQYEDHEDEAAALTAIEHRYAEYIEKGENRCSFSSLLDCGGQRRWWALPSDSLCRENP